MKQRTAMMLLIDKLKRMPDSNIKNYLNILGNEYIESEKEQIMEAYKYGYMNGSSMTQDFKNDYYNETYKQD